MTYAQQIRKLREKGLWIQNDVDAEEILKQYSYFALISGYKDLFKNPTTRCYRDGTKLEDILALYRFDANLRELTFHYLLEIEQQIRSVLGYAFCERFGAEQEHYLDARSYNGDTAKKRMQVQKLIERYLRPLLERKTQYPYIEHQKQIYGNVPLWVLVKALTFGTLSKMYELAVSEVQSDISREFPELDERQLGQFLNYLTDYRNLCAHNERLFSHRCAQKDIPDMPVHKQLPLPRKGNTYQQGKRDYLAVMIAFRYLLKEEDYRVYLETLKALLDNFCRTENAVSRERILSEMGIPTEDAFEILKA